MPQSTVFHANQIAAELYVRDKAEVVKMVEEKYDAFGPGPMELADAFLDAQVLIDSIRSGEARLAVALAIVEGED